LESKIREGVPKFPNFRRYVRKNVRVKALGHSEGLTVFSVKRDIHFAVSIIYLYLNRKRYLLLLR